MSARRGRRRALPCWLLLSAALCLVGSVGGWPAAAVRAAGEAGGPRPTAEPGGDLRPLDHAGGEGPVDPIRLPRDGTGDVHLTIGFTLSPAGLVAAVPYGDGWARYAEATTEAALHLGARMGLGEGVAIAFGWRGGLSHYRQAVQGGEEASRFAFQAFRWNGAALHYQSPRSARGRALGLSLRLAPARRRSLEVGLSHIRDPLVLFSALLLEGSRAPGDSIAMGVSAGATFVANERVSIKGAAAIRLPLAGAEAPSSSLVWRAGYQLDAEGDRQIALHGAWAFGGDEPRVTLGVEWETRIGRKGGRDVETAGP